MNLHLNLNLKQMSNMIYDDSRRTEEEEAIVKGVSRSMRGLSKFYEGKSQSFTSLANVKSLEDLMKRGFKNRNYGAGRKACRSTGGIIDQSYKRVYNPKATISKKPTRTPSSALSCLSRRRH
ncbi:unnamed protein product [Thlaspi arvense]|uniref:Uncharacterized protein n=1 Tax=Thlaspi arvense TaxID=13288 RepID=A0AAU9SNV8_THLAR|nr:unnamed protein product [Thlaspi arvense]